MKKKYLVHAAFFLAIVVAAFAFNWQFLLHAGNAEVMQMNDHADIVKAFHQTSFWRDHWRWWNGTAPAAFAVYRPLMSYFGFFEVWIGLHFGWVYVGWIGFAMYVAVISLVSLLAWRWTQNIFCVLAATAYCITIRFWNPGQDGLWLIWFSGHQELLTIGWTLATMLYLDSWLKNRQRSHLLATFVCFIIGCLTKEYVYIFPVIALTQVVLCSDYKTRRNALAVVGGMFCFVVLLWLFRAHVLSGAAHIRNPTLKPMQFVRKPIIFAYAEAGRYLFTGAAWLPCFALWWFGCAGLWLRLRQNAQRRGWSNCTRATRWFLNSAGGISLVVAAAVCSISWLWRIPVTETVMIFLDPSRAGGTRRWDAGLIFFDCYTLWLVWKYRRDEMLLVAWLCWMLSYGPVLDYIGWHYTLGPQMLKAVYLAVLAKLMWRDLDLMRFANVWPNRFLAPSPEAVAKAAS